MVDDSLLERQWLAYKLEGVAELSFATTALEGQRLLGEHEFRAVVIDAVLEKDGDHIRELSEGQNACVFSSFSEQYATGRPDSVPFFGKTPAGEDALMEWIAEGLA